MGMFQAVDPKGRGAPLGNGTGEGFRAQHSLLAAAGVWILEVLRVQAIPCSFFLLGFGLFLGLDAKELMMCNLVFPISRLSELSPCPFLFKKEDAFECIN